MFSLHLHNLRQAATFPHYTQSQMAKTAKFLAHLQVQATLTSQRNLIMPARYQRNDFGSFPIKYTDTQFSDRDNQLFTTWYTTDNPMVGELYLKALVDGWKFSNSWKEDQAAVLCSATMVNDKHPRYGYCVTSWSDDPLESVFMTVFKIGVLYAEQPLPEQRQQGRRG